MFIVWLEGPRSWKLIAMDAEASSRKALVPRGKVKCGVCGQKLLFLIRLDTYSCKRCKKTLPRRFAVPRG